MENPTDPKLGIRIPYFGFISKSFNLLIYMRMEMKEKACILPWDYKKTIWALLGGLDWWGLHTTLSKSREMED